jgi:gamma-glutamyltranspeptidase/glutathione hydrolase
VKFEAYSYPSRRSAVIARNGLVATSQPLAAQAGLAVLQAGGNAVDAAIATVATLCVTEPCSTGIGGDAFALMWLAGEGRLVGLNASGPAPQAMTGDWMRAQGYDTFPARGGLAVTVPGSLRGWEEALARYGTMPLGRLLEQPIAYARDGFPVSQRIAQAWQRSADLLGEQPDSARVWLPGGRAPRAGEMFRNPEVAATLSLIAEQGYDAFYTGAVADQIVMAVQVGGGLMTHEDLAAYRAEWVEPISVGWDNGFAFHEIPPNGQGLTALLALNITREALHAGLAYGSADYYHLLIEATKLAFADAETYIADPRLAPVPMEGLLSIAYAQERAGLIDMGRASLPRAGDPPRGDTVYLTVADKDGNMVSWIQSLYMGFGSGLNAGRTGVQLQNRGANFSLVPGHANEVAPGKRPYQTIIPGFITRDGQPWSSFGVMGGFMQPQGHLQVGLNLVREAMDPQTALDAPRFNWLEGRRVALEAAAGPDVRQELTRRGHDLLPLEVGVHYGGGQLIVRDPGSGVLIGGSEPRNDGAAAGW